MPVDLSVAADESHGHNADYFVLTGKGTMFSGKEGIKFQDITGGTSNTIMIVEANRDIPWTKPEDIDYDPSQPLPKLGGHSRRRIPGGLRRRARSDSSPRRRQESD